MSLTKVVYCDGSCLDNGTPKARGGIGIYVPDEKREISEPLGKNVKHTNQTAELTAVIHTLILYPQTRLKIFTDSTYVINCATTWITNWKKNGWKKKSSNKTVENLDLIKKLDVLLSARKSKIEWVHVRGHSNDEGNDKADLLAKQGSRRV
jgi:ribonuclease HI